MSLALRLITTVSLLAAGGCDDSAQPPPDDGTHVTGLLVTSRSGRLQAAIPSAFVVQRHQNAIVATTADGNGRIYVGRIADTAGSAALGAFKDDLLGLGAEIIEEKHLKRATRLVSSEGRRDARIQRRTWVIDDDGAGVILCEALFAPDGEAEWNRLVDALCLQARHIATPAPSSE